MNHIDIVFTKLPSHEPAEFVEVENAQGRSIRFGEWVERDDGYAVLRITNPEIVMMSLGSVIAHLLEYIDTGHAFDLQAAMSGVQSIGLINFANENAALLPQRRDGIPQAKRFNGEVSTE